MRDLSEARESIARRQVRVRTTSEILRSGIFRDRWDLMDNFMGKLIIIFAGAQGKAGGWLQ